MSGWRASLACASCASACARSGCSSKSMTVLQQASIVFDLDDALTGAEHFDIGVDIAVRRPGNNRATEAGGFDQVVAAGIVKRSPHDDDLGMGH